MVFRLPLQSKLMRVPVVGYCVMGGRVEYKVFEWLTAIEVGWSI